MGRVLQSDKIRDSELRLDPDFISEIAETSAVSLTG